MSLSGLRLEFIFRGFCVIWRMYLKHLFFVFLLRFSLFSIHRTAEMCPNCSVERTGGTRRYCLSLKHSLASSTWKPGAFHTSHDVRTEGTSILHGLPASSAVYFCTCPLVSGALAKETGLCWSLVVTYGLCAWTMEELAVIFWPDVLELLSR